LNTFEHVLQIHVWGSFICFKGLYCGLHREKRHFRILTFESFGDFRVDGHGLVAPYHCNQNLEGNVFEIGLESLNFLKQEDMTSEGYVFNVRSKPHIGVKRLEGFVRISKVGVFYHLLQ
jgi:hypothetical protein